MKKNSLRFHIWLYFVLFALVILFILWLSQILFLDSYYKWTKNRNIKKIALKVSEIYQNDDSEDNLDILSFNKDVCIEIFKSDELIYSSGNINHGCMLNNHDKESNEKRNEFIHGDKKNIKYTLLNPLYESKVLVYGVKLDDESFAFISTPLEPIKSTVGVLIDQFKYVTIGVFILSFIIAYFVAKRISKPIIKISKTSSLISKGQYHITFDESDIKELNELAITLNNAALELSKTDELRRELMANVSHDLKTPLTIIRANAEMVRDLTYDKEEKRNNNLSVIVKEVDRLNSLVEDILDVSKAGSNTMNLEIVEFNLSEIMDNVLSKYNVLVELEGYQINLKKDNDFKVLGDIKRIEQVIYNLINNAINYTGDDKVININIKDNNDKVLIEIIDTGNGISEENLKHIWDKYYKVDKQYHRVTYGTGLGLSIVKNVLELHHYKYGVESKIGVGTKFYFYLDKSK